MDLEFQQLDLRYEALRIREPERERRLLASLAERGQQIPIVVVGGAEGTTSIVVDGYKRVRALRRLGSDTVAATRWDLDEPEALILDRLLRTSGRGSALEEAWLLSTLERQFARSPLDLARHFDRSESWISRRLGLVRALPLEVQEQVQLGRIVPHAAMKYLLPLARANADDCVRLVRAVRRRMSSREVGRLYSVWLHGDEPTRERLIADPELFVRVEEEVARPAPTASETLIEDLKVIGAVARRAERRLREGAARGLRASRRSFASRLAAQAHADLEVLFEALTKEQLHAGSEHASRGAAAQESGTRHAYDRRGAAHFPGGGEGDPEGGDRRDPHHQPGGEG
jgi:ParB/RepB/Spo0J family partition protein